MDGAFFGGGGGVVGGLVGGGRWREVMRRGGGERGVENTKSHRYSRIELKGRGEKEKFTG